MAVVLAAKTLHTLFPYIVSGFSTYMPAGRFRLHGAHVVIPGCGSPVNK